MSKSVCFRIEGFTSESGYFVPAFNTINDFSVKIGDRDALQAIYVTYLRIDSTYVVRGEILDFIIGQFNTIREVIEWIDANIRLIFRHYDHTGVIACYAKRHFAFVHNGVERITALNDACKDCMDNHLLLSLKERFRDEVEVRDIVVNPDEGFEHVEYRGGYGVYFDSRIYLSSPQWPEQLYVPDGVVRLLIGLDVGTICDIIAEARCYREEIFDYVHTLEECQCNDCYSEEMVVCVEAILARMT
jgi:hypothetical protein